MEVRVRRERIVPGRHPPRYGAYFLSLAQVSALTSLGASTVKRMATDGSFPKPVPIGKRRQGYLEDEVLAWCDQRVAAARGKN